MLGLGIGESGLSSGGGVSNFLYGMSLGKGPAFRFRPGEGGGDSIMLFSVDCE